MTFSTSAASTELPASPSLVASPASSGQTESTRVEHAAVPSSSSPSSAQTPAAATAQTVVDTSALIAQYEQRLRHLMSEKDKAIHERNQAIAQLAELQRTYEELQKQTQSSLSGAASAAQDAINRANTLEQQLAAVRGEALRAQTLLEKPHLAPYAQFIPATEDAEAVRKAVETLEQIRQQDLARHSGMVPGTVSPAGMAVAPTPAAGAGSPTGGTIAALYAGRQNIPTSLLSAAGSSPAQMSPTAATDPTRAIQALFDEARKSGNPADFEKAVQQAAVLSRSAIDQQLGRSS